MIWEILHCYSFQVLKTPIDGQSKVKLPILYSEGWIECSFVVKKRRVKVKQIRKFGLPYWAKTTATMRAIAHS